MVDELGLLEDPIVPFVTTRSLDDNCLLSLFKVFLAPPLLSPPKTPTPTIELGLVSGLLQKMARHVSGWLFERAC
jgi:hypothetical protein